MSFTRILAAAVTIVCLPNIALGQADRDCSDFNTQEEAQRFYERSGPGDPHRLDRDNDGIACETLP
jgi:hypothetical protein